MARETAAQKLARKQAEEAAAAAAPPPVVEPPPEPVKAAPVRTPYMLFGLDGNPAEVGSWVHLDEVPATSYQQAMELAKDRMRDRILAQATEEAPAPATLKITVAAIASRNWNQGTAIIESRPVTTWEK